MPTDNTHPIDSKTYPVYAFIEGRLVLLEKHNYCLHCGTITHRDDKICVWHLCDLEEALKEDN